MADDLTYDEMLRVIEILETAAELAVTVENANFVLVDAADRLGCREADHFAWMRLHRAALTAEREHDSTPSSPADERCRALLAAAASFRTRAENLRRHQAVTGQPQPDAAP